MAPHAVMSYQSLHLFVCRPHQALDLGSWLQHRYIHTLRFLPAVHRPDALSARTTLIDRAYQTLRGVVTGLYPAAAATSSLADAAAGQRQRGGLGDRVRGTQDVREPGAAAAAGAGPGGGWVWVENDAADDEQRQQELAVHEALQLPPPLGVGGSWNKLHDVFAAMSAQGVALPRAAKGPVLDSVYAQALRHEGYLIGPRPGHGILSPQQCTESLRLAVGPLAHRLLSHMEMASEATPPSGAAAEDAALAQAADGSEGSGASEDSSHVTRTGLSSAVLGESGSSIGGSSGSGSSSRGRGEDSSSSSSSRAALLRGNAVGGVGSDSSSPGASPPPSDSGSHSGGLTEGRELLPLAGLDLRSASATGGTWSVGSGRLRRLRRALVPLQQTDLPGVGGSSDDGVQSSGVDGQWQQQHQPRPLMYLFSGHDSTITPLLASKLASLLAVWLVHRTDPLGYEEHCIGSYGRPLDPLPGEALAFGDVFEERTVPTRTHWRDSDFVAGPQARSGGQPYFPPIPGRGLASVEQKPYAQLVAALGSYFPLLHSMLRACYLEESFLLQAAQRYTNYLTLLKSEPSSEFLPTVDIEMMWRIHLAYSGNYRSDTLRLFGVHLPYNSASSGGERLSYNGDEAPVLLAHTKKAYEAMFGQLFDHPATCHQLSDPHPATDTTARPLSRSPQIPMDVTHPVADKLWGLLKYFDPPPATVSASPYPGEKYLLMKVLKPRAGAHAMFLLWHLKRRLEEKRGSSCACFFVPEREAIKATVYNAARFCRFKGLPTTTAHRYLASAITIKTSQWFLTVAPTSIILPSDPHQLELFVSEQRRHLGVDEAGRRWAVPGLLGLGGCEGFDAHGRTGMDEAGRGTRALPVPRGYMGYDAMMFYYADVFAYSRLYMAFDTAYLSDCGYFDGQGSFQGGEFGGGGSYGGMMTGDPGMIDAYAGAGSAVTDGSWGGAATAAPDAGGGANWAGDSGGGADGGGMGMGDGGMGGGAM
ncbi:MAG: hypothetical protein WDW38_009825 [Sanguina aurantia]